MSGGAPIAGPTVSVIMAAYKGAGLVTETLDSLAAQSFGDFELVVVDDASPDDTLAVLRAFGDPRVTIIETPANAGPVRARNRAFAAARGRYIAALDQDDLCRPERFARQVRWLDAHPDTVLVGTANAFLEDGIVRPGRAPHVTSPGLIDWMMHLVNPLAWSSVMFRAEAARRLDPFTRPELLYAEDFDLYHRLRPFGQIARIDEELTVYRCHAGGVSTRFSDAMTRSAERVVARAHRAIFGDGAKESAALVTRHVAARQPVPDRATLARLTSVMARLAGHFAAADPEAGPLIARETSRLWWDAARAGVRSGAIGLGGAIAARRGAARLGDARPADLLLSGLIGGGRALSRRARPR